MSSYSKFSIKALLFTLNETFGCFFKNRSWNTESKYLVNVYILGVFSFKN